MSTLLTRAPRALMMAVAAIFTLSLLSPLAILANSDLTVGSQAIISNPEGSGANLRSDYSILDESTVISEIPQDTVVTIVDGPYVAETGVWYWVVANSPVVEGWVEASLLRASGEETDPDLEAAAPDLEAAELDTPEVPEVTGLPWLEPIDSGVVVDDNIELPEGGLVIRVSATVDGEVIGRAPVGTWLDVTEQRIWDDQGRSFVRVNFNGEGGYVNGDFVVLTSENAPEETAVEEPVAPEDLTVEETIVEDTVELPVEVEPPVIEEPVAPEAPVIEEPVAPEAPVIEEPVIEAPIEVSAETETLVETEESVVEETVEETTPVVTEDASLDAEITDEPTVEDELLDETVVEETVQATAETASSATTEDAVVTDEPVVEEATEVPAETEEPVVADEPNAEQVEEASLNEDEADEARIDSTEDATVEAPAAPATTVAAFDEATMIGSATVTGTVDGLICRVAPEANAATLTILPEGTKVLVFAEAVNGYLGIDCGGLQGYADVNYLWSGGAGDEAINKSNMSVVVTGTGNGLNCRTGASTGHPVIAVLRDGTTLTTRGASSNGWTPVTCGGQAGFVSTAYIEVASGSGSTGSNTGSSGSTSGSGTATVVNTGSAGLNCRSGAGSSYSVITVLSPNQSVTVRGAAQGGWLPIICGGAQGWASAQYLSVSAGSPAPAPSSPTPTPEKAAPSTGTVTVANTGGSGLNCRSGAGTSFPVITVLSLGQSVSTRSGSTSGWTAVICGGQNGFVADQYVTSGGSSAPAPSKPTPADPESNIIGTATVSNTGSSGLNCRSGAGSSYSVITVLAANQKVDVRGEAQNGWLPIICGGAQGWASTQYLTVGGSSTPAPSNPAPSEPTPAPQPSGMKNGDHAQSTASVNLRYSASLSSGVATVVPSGTVVLVTGGQSNGFYPVDYDGLRGFMSADYLVKTSAELSKRGGSANPTTPTQPTNPGGASATGNALVDYAMNYVGYPYVWATHGPSSFDCSGFTYWVVKNVTGKNIGTGTWTQVSAGAQVSKSNLQPGDLVFFQNTYTTGLSHVGMYIGNGQFIHAQNESTGVVISDLNSSYYGPRWYGAVRVV